jgi:hypothetical protein
LLSEHDAGTIRTGPLRGERGNLVATKKKQAKGKNLKPAKSLEKKQPLITFSYGGPKGTYQGQ